MKRKAVSLFITTAIWLGLWSFAAAPIARAAGVTYYSQGSLAPNLTASWNTIRAGGGTAPANFASRDIFVIQNGHTMTANAAWAVSGTGAKIEIESGGVLIGNDQITVPTFQLDNGSLYIHNFAVVLPGTTRTFAAASTIEFQKKYGYHLSGQCELRKFNYQHQQLHAKHWL